MFEKIKNIFKEKDEKKKTENLVAFLIILVITLIIVNKILSNDKRQVSNTTGVELVNKEFNDANNVNQLNQNEYGLEKELETILSQIEGVRKS